MSVSRTRICPPGPSSSLSWGVLHSVSPVSIATAVNVEEEEVEVTLGVAGSQAVVVVVGDVAVEDRWRW